MSNAEGETTLDHLLGGRLHLRQPAKGHRAGTDTMLLAAAAPETSGTLVDLGAGVGTAGLAVVSRGGAGRTLLIEVQPELAALARENIALNGFEGRAQVVCADALSAPARRAAGLANGCADVLITNPPWLDPARAQVSPDRGRAIAHAASAEGLTQWLRAASALLRPGGRFVMIHRADCLGAAITACAGRFGGIAITPVYPREGEAATRILLRAIKGSRAPLTIAPPIIVHEAGGGFTARAVAMHEGRELI